MNWITAELASREALTVLAERAMDQIDNYLMRDDDFLEEERRDARIAFDRAVWALRFCAMELGSRRDPELLPIVCSIVEMAAHVNHELRDGFEPVAYGLELLLEVANDPEAAEFLVDNDEPKVRAALARSVRADSRTGRAMLERLVDDAAPDVRDAARASLEKVGGVPWWRGVFQADPTEGMTREQALALKAPLEAVTTILGKPAYALGRHIDELRKLLKQLPDGPARDVGEILARGSGWGVDGISGVLRDALARPGGPEYALRLLRGLAGTSRGAFTAMRVTKAVAELPTEKRQAVCDRLVVFVFDAPRPTWDEHDSMASLAADVIRDAWTARGDVNALLDRLLAEPEGGDGEAVFGPLSQVIASSKAAAAKVLPRVFEALESNLPGAWARLSHACLAAAAHASKSSRRKLATRLLDVGNERLKGWALERLLGELHTPSRDAPRRELAASYARDPRTRDAMLADVELCERALPVLREALRAGALPLSGAGNVLRAIDSVYDGFSSTEVLAFLFKQRGQDDIVERRRLRAEGRYERRRAELVDFIGPPEEQVSITREEWSEWRRLRANALAHDPKLDGLDDPLEVLPEGPIDLDDRAFVEHVMAVWRETRHGPFAHGIIPRLTQHADPWLVPFLDEFVRYPMGDERAPTQPPDA